MVLVEFNFSADGVGLIVFLDGTTEKLRIASSGQIGLGGANYGTSGQVLTSNGSGSAPTWQDWSGGGAGGGITTTHQQVQSTTATGISTFSTTDISFSTHARWYYSRNFIPNWSLSDYS